MFKQVMPLSAIIAMRFFGLFIVLPVISAYAIAMNGATPFLVGIVLGGYALTQVVFQVPFGIMSDKIGRKQTILIGIVVFILGSIICSISTDIYTLIFGRFLQGAGAIGAVISAMISDLVKEEVRTKAMAMMGGSIALAFSAAMVAGPLVSASFGVGALFDIAAFLAFVSLVILYTVVPNPPKIVHKYSEDFNIGQILRDSKINKMNVTNFLQKGFMTMAFMLIPVALMKNFGWSFHDLVKVYAPSMVAGIFAMAPAAILAEKKGKFKQVLIAGIVFFMASFLAMGFANSATFFVVGVVLFFIGFNMHEPIMQSLASKYAKVHEKGTVLGIFNAYGYLGTFFGGVAGGLFFNSALHELALAIALICGFWIALIATLPNPTKTKVAYFALADINPNGHDILADIEGVEEVYENETEQTLVAKYHEDVVTLEELKRSLAR